MIITSIVSVKCNTNLCPNLSGGLITQLLKSWISNYIPLFKLYVPTYSCVNISLTILVKRGLENGLLMDHLAKTQQDTSMFEAPVPINFDC